MKTGFRNIRNMFCLFAIVLLLVSCISYRYIGDMETLQRQKEIHGKRVGNVILGSFLAFGSALATAFTGIDVSYIPEDQYFKHLRLVNNSSDTLLVNMLTDRVWKDSAYCDFRNIRIPPGDKCRLLVPVNSDYNLYFSNTFGNENDDELLEINTSGKGKIVLHPGMALQDRKDTITEIKNLIP